MLEWMYEGHEECLERDTEVIRGVLGLSDLLLAQLAVKIYHPETLSDAVLITDLCGQWHYD